MISRLDRGRFAFLRRLLRCPSQVLCFMSLSPSGLPASLRLIHASVNNFETTKDVIFASRGFISVVNSHVFLAMKSFSHNSHSVTVPLSLFVLFVSGATMAHSVRRAPNAMNFLRQLEILKKSGEADNFDDLNLVGAHSHQRWFCLRPNKRTMKNCY